MVSTAQPIEDLRAFRDSFYRCFGRRADALFELTDALLSAASVPSPVHLSLAPVHRRGWGSLYAALGRGRIDEGPLRDLLARHHPAGDGERPSVYAVDVSVWSRCNAEASPGEVTTTIRRGTPPGSPSSPGGPTNWSPGSPSSATRG